MNKHYVKTVSRKGQVVIPADIRRRLGLKRKIIFKEEQGKVSIEPIIGMEDAFGAGGEVMYEVAVEISEDRRREVEHEKAKVPF